MWFKTELITQADTLPIKKEKEKKYEEVSMELEEMPGQPGGTFNDGRTGRPAALGHGYVDSDGVGGEPWEKEKNGSGRS